MERRLDDVGEVRFVMRAWTARTLTIAQTDQPAPRSRASGAVHYQCGGRERAVGKILQIVVIGTGSGSDRYR